MHSLSPGQPLPPCNQECPSTLSRVQTAIRRRLRVFAGADIWGYLGLAFGLSGCGGLQRSEFASYPVQALDGRIVLE
jgi:hypothetical protein